MRFKDQSLNLLNVVEENRKIVVLLNTVAQFLASFTNNNVRFSENTKHEIKTLTLKDGVQTKINHNGKEPPIAVVVLDGRVEWLKTVDKDNNQVTVLCKTNKVACEKNFNRSQILNFSSAKYFMKDDTISCGQYRAKVTNATKNSVTLEKAIILEENELGLYEEQVTLLLLW